ncbi:hypothetical protein Hanom_Chr03g00205531 [Helianthus anomalus]
MYSVANPSTKKRKYKPRNLPGPDCADIRWKEEENHNLVRDMGFHSEWGAQFLTPKSTALDAPPGYIMLYVAYFREGNFRLPMTKFTGEVLTNYGLHISQINALSYPGLPTLSSYVGLITLNRLSRCLMFFYFVSYTGGFYSFNSRTSGEWYKVLTRKVTSITQLEERALVGAGMSMLWVPRNPRGVPVYGYQGKVGYSFLNVLDPKAAGAMVEAILPEGKSVWLDQIRDRLLHPTSDSFSAYANVILGEDDGVDLDDATDPNREEVIVLSSEGSDRSREGLIPRSPRAGPTQGAINEPVNEPAGDDVDVPSDAAEQLEARKKKKVDRSEKKKKVEEPVAKAPCKQPSNFSPLDYVVVSDTLSCLDAGDKRVERDPDDDATLTEIMKKEKAPRKVDISKITPFVSLPSRTLDMSPPHDDLGEKKKKADVEVEQVGEGGAAGAGGDAGDACGDGRGEGVDTEAESSGATPRHTIYTKVVRGSGQGGAFGTHHTPEYEHVQGGSWDTHSPACADLPHAPRWNLTQGSRMTELANCREFFSLSLPPAERLFQKRHNRLDLLDDHIHAGVNFFATSQEIAREWQLFGEDNLEFENARRRMLKREKNLMPRRREVACERTNKELQTQRDAIVRLSGEKRNINDEAEQERVVHQKREQEYIQRIAKLEKFAEEKVAEVKTSEILAEEVAADCRWLLARAVPRISERITGSEELAKYMYELGEAAYDHGRKDGYVEGRAAAEAKEPLKNFELYKTDCVARYAEKRQESNLLNLLSSRRLGSYPENLTGSHC